MKVLLVGHREEERAAFAPLLHALDVQVLAAGSGYEAIKLLSRERNIVVVILDAGMPAMGDFALAALIRESEHARQTPLTLIFDRDDGRAISFPGRENAPVEVLYRPIEPNVATAQMALLLELARQRRLLSAEKAETTRLQAALRDSELRYELVGKATRDGVYDWDLLTNAVHWNEAVRAEYGYPESETHNDYVWWCERIHPEDRLRVLEEVQAFIAGRQERWMCEYRFRKADGSYAYVFDRGYLVRDSAGKPLRMIGAMQDLTARKQAEEALRESEQHFRRGEERLEHAIQASHVGIWEIDLDDYRMWRNEEHDRAFGYKQMAPDWTRDIFYAHVHPEDRAYVREAEERAMNDGRSFNQEFRVLWPDGSVHWMATSGKVRRDENGRPATIVGTNQDITERKRIEEELREAVRARDEFLSVASHELKTPLTAIGLQTQIIKRNVAKSGEAALSPEKISKLIDQVDRQVRRLTRVVDDMLDISRLATGKLAVHLEPFDLAEMVYEVVDRLAPQVARAGSTVSIDTQSAEGQWDRFRIEQVLINLLTNAARYGQGKPIEISVRKTDTHAEVRVRDYGRGIAREDQERIFQRFERVSSDMEPGGLGLGLFIVRQILNLHGGSIRVESNVGQGALFIVELPLAEPGR